MFIIKYKSRLQEPAAKPVDCSNKIVTIYKLAYDENHLVKIVEKEKVNIFEKIQSYKNDVDFARILKTIELTENPMLYAEAQRNDIDLTQMPQDFVAAQKVVAEAKAKEAVVKNSEYFKSKGISFDEFIKNYSALDHAQFLKSKYEKKEENK